MKYILFSFILCYSFHNSYAQESKLQISPKFGFRLHTNALPGLRVGGSQRLISSPLLGVTFSFAKRPYSISVEKDWNLRFNPYPDTDLGHIGQYWTETSGVIRYKFNKFGISTGYFQMKRENTVSFDLGQSAARTFKGIFVGIHKEFDWLGVELRSRIPISPVFDALVGIENYNIILSYKLKKNNVDSQSTSIFDDKLHLRVNIGARFFPVEGIEVLSNETFPRIGISPSIGIELQYIKSGISFNVEKDFWFSVNGGSSNREVKGYFVNTFIGFRYHIELKNTRHFRMGAGYSFIRDLDKMARPYKVGFHNYQVKGMGASISYEVIKNTDIELKHTFSIKSIDDEPLLRPMRFSGGIIYRIRPK